jgi:hypothetical protein
LEKERLAVGKRYYHPAGGAGGAESWCYAALLLEVRHSILLLSHAYNNNHKTISLEPN